MQNLENLDVFEMLITQKLLKCPKDPFVRSALKCTKNVPHQEILSHLFFLVLQLKYLVDVQNNSHNELVKSITI